MNPLYPGTEEATLALDWSFYGPVLIFVALIGLGVPVWVAIGATSIALLLWSGVLPLSLLGGSLFEGIDAFALTAVPLFILTGDVLVRTGLSRKFLDVAEALTTWSRSGFGSATVLVCGMFSAISGSDAAGAAMRVQVSHSVPRVDQQAGVPLGCAVVARAADWSLV